MGKGNHRAEAVVGDHQQMMLKPAGGLAQFDEFVGVARGGDDGHQAVVGRVGQPVDRRAVTALQDMDTPADLGQGPSHVIGKGIGDPGTDQVNGRALLELRHDLCQDTHVDAFIKLSQVAHFFEDHPVQQVGSRSLHPGQIHPVRQAQPRIHKVAQRLQEFPIPPIAQLPHEPDHRGLADPAGLGKLFGRHEHRFTGILDNIVSDDLSFGCQRVQLRDNTLDHRVCLGFIHRKPFEKRDK